MRLNEIFETKPCTRCGGSGRYSYNQIDGDRCYGCSGSGQQFSKQDQPLVNDFVEAKRRAKEVVVAGRDSHYDRLAVGMKLKHPDGSKGFVNDAGQRRIPFVTVTAIEQTAPEQEGVTGAGRYTLHLSDGTTWNTSGGILLSRVATLSEILALCKNPETERRVRAAYEQEKAQASELAAA